MSDEPPVQIPAARLSERHVDHAIAASERSDRWRQRREAVRWLTSPIRWFVANAKDVWAAAGVAAAILVLLNSIGVIDLSSWPSVVVRLLEGLGG